MKVTSDTSFFDGLLFSGKNVKKLNKKDKNIDDQKLVADLVVSRSY